MQLRTAITGFVLSLTFVASASLAETRYEKLDGMFKSANGSINLEALPLVLDKANPLKCVFVEAKSPNELKYKDKALGRLVKKDVNDPVFGDDGEKTVVVTSHFWTTENMHAPRKVILKHSDTSYDESKNTLSTTYIFDTGGSRHSFYNKMYFKLKQNQETGYYLISLEETTGYTNYDQWGYEEGGKAYKYSYRGYCYHP